MTRPSATCSGGFSETESSHSTGTRAKISTSVIAMLQSVMSLPSRLISASGTAFLDLDAEALDEDRRDDDDDHEQQHRHGRAEPEVQTADQLVEAEDRDRFGFQCAAGHDEDRVEDAEALERAEQQGDEDRRFHQRQGDPGEALPGTGAV